LAGRVAVVTGAGRGLGRAVAAGFVRAGATTWAIARTGAELEDFTASLGPEAGLLTIDQVDVADDAAVRKLAERVLARHGRIDVLVNNAAIMEIVPFHAMTMVDFDRTLNIDLRGAIACTHAVIGAMSAAGRGSIINVASENSYQGAPGATHYCAAKFGLEGFSEALAMEARAYNVAVNRLEPGIRIPIKPTSVTLAAAAATPPATRRRWQDPAPMVDAFVYLALQDGSGVTGYRFDAVALAECVRENGWDRRYTPADVEAQSWPVARDAQGEAEGG
jgi:NAD(P)-dependent dehydrogenase (short-subunit alcohol dehydrogenase family)